jgi:hypothetical protein
MSEGQMKDEEVIAALVKGRERCRQIVQLYQNLREASETRSVRSNDLATANRIMSQMLEYLHSLPRKPSQQMTSPSLRGEAERLLREIGDLLECAIVAERNLREQAGRSPSAPVGMARLAAIEQYGGTSA